MNIPSRKKVLLLGLDGATWRIIQPLFAQGKLPNLQRLVHEGSSGVLKSLEPMVSPTIWTSIASGKRPEKHGVWDFVVAAKNVRCKRIWDMTTERGIKTGLCSYMVTWPPPEVHGFVIPGSFSRGVETHPASLQPIRELDVMQRSEHRKTPTELLKLAWQCRKLGVRSSSFVAAASTLAQIKMNGEFLAKFFETRRIGAQFYADVFVRQARAFQTELSMYITMLIDATSHNYWKFMEPERFAKVDQAEVEKYRDTIYRAYESSDATLGYILQNLRDENTVVLVLSDHGFQSVPEAQGRTPDRTVRILPEALMTTLGWNLEKVRTFNIRGSTFFRDQEENAARIQQMEEDLCLIRLAASNAMLFNVSRDPSNNLEIRLRDEVEELDDLAVRLPDGRVIAANKIIEGDTGGISGDHHPDGILIAAGAGIRRGHQLASASVLDITPTLLALLGLPVGRDMDGRVLEELFVEKPPVQFIDTWENAAWQFQKDEEESTEELKNHLRSLGYL